jgi:hypothetical protein
MFWRLAALLVVAPAGTAQAAEAVHVHGRVTLDVAIEARSVTIHMESPLDNLVGFEHAPRTDAQRKVAQAAITRLRAGAELFRIDPQGGCTFKGAELTSAALGLGQAAKEASESAHADLDATFEFTCTAGDKASFVELGLIGAFTGVRSIEAQIVTPGGQFKRELQSPASRLAWAR